MNNNTNSNTNNTNINNIPSNTVPQVNTNNNNNGIVNSTNTTVNATINNPVNNNVTKANHTNTSTTQPNNSTPSNDSNSQNNIKIQETSVTKSQKGTLTVATLNNGTVNIVNNSFPEQIDINVKANKIVTKNGKRVRIMTKRELITNIILSFFFVLALCGVGYGTYYYIFRNNPRNFETKNVTVEYGEEIPVSVKNYINLTDISEPDYNLDLSAVKNEIGTYTYKVSYGNTVKIGTITINDTKAPVITFKTLTDINSDTEITKDMLVESCEDPSDCTYDLTSPVDTTNPGEVTASITAKDNLGNSKDYTIKLNIIEKIINIVCKGTVVTTDESGKTILESNNYNLKFNTSKNLKPSTLNTIRTYLSESDYLSVKDGLTANGYTLEEANKRAQKDSSIDNVANLTTQDEIKTHLESSGYTCTIDGN